MSFHLRSFMLSYSKGNMKKFDTAIDVFESNEQNYQETGSLKIEKNHWDKSN